MVYTFWEGRMPDYIKMCMSTWNFPYVLLTYDKLNKFTNIPIDKLDKFTLPQVADIVRVHVLRDNGGYWLDADTIMLSDKLPTEDMMGYVEERTNTIGYLHTEPHSDMFEEWAHFQDCVINNNTIIDDVLPLDWDIVGNRFTDPYVKEHKEISICDVSNKWAETYMIDGDIPRPDKYKYLYFVESYHLPDLKPTNMLMLHNSWTPNWYKLLSKEQILDNMCTMSNILREVTK